MAGHEDPGGLHSWWCKTLKPCCCMCARAGDLEVCLDHLAHQLVEAGLRPPAQLRPAPSCVAQQRLDLGRAEVARVHLHEHAAAAAVDALLRRRPRLATRCHAELAAAALVTNSRTECCSPVAMTKSSGCVLLQHQPLGLHVVSRVAPVALGVQVAEVQALRSSPSLMRASPRVILRVTNVSPRSGDSWLKRMPLQANMP